MLNQNVSINPALTKKQETSIIVKEVEKMSMVNGMAIMNENKEVMDVFSITGFDRILTIK